MESIFFTILLVIVSLGGLIALAFTNWWIVGLSLTIWIVFGYITVGPQVLSWASINWPWVIFSGLVWLAIGGMWSLFKWYQFTHSEQMLRQIKHDHSRWVEEGSRDTFKKSDHFPYSLNSQKNEVLIWIVFWPLSMASYFLVDMIKDIANFVYEKMANLFGSVTDHAIRKATKGD